MMISIIQAVEKRIDAKRESGKFVTNDDIRKMFKAYTKDIQDSTESKIAIHLAQEFFIRKYGI